MGYVVTKIRPLPSRQVRCISGIGVIYVFTVHFLWATLLQKYGPCQAGK